MKKITKKFGKFFALALAMMMIGAMFAMPASAHDHIDAEDMASVVYYVYEDGHVTTERAASLCGCSNSNVLTYKLTHTDDRLNDLCTVVVREYCDNCGWYRDVETYGIGGHSSYYSYPKWPYNW